MASSSENQSVIDVCERYGGPTGSFRLRGTRVGYTKVGIWHWFYPDGHSQANWDYETSQWIYYTQTHVKKWSGNGYVADSEVNPQALFATEQEHVAFNHWFEEAVSLHNPILLKDWVDNLNAQYRSYQQHNPTDTIV